MEKEIKNNQWKVYGKCKEPNGKANTDGAIKLPEQISNLGFRVYDPKPKVIKSSIPEESFGRPIKADVAVNMIKKAHEKTTAFFSKYLLSFTHDDKEKKAAENTVDCLENLFYGVAFNKTIILKILSQPNCEGIRSYLCARDLKTGGIHFSLVMVGIDKDGYDLNYPPVTRTPDMDPLEDNDDTVAKDILKTLSLTGEYGNPPGNGGPLKFGGTVPIDNHYYLLKQAIGG